MKILLREFSKEVKLFIFRVKNLEIFRNLVKLLKIINYYYYYFLDKIYFNKLFLRNF